MKLVQVNVWGGRLDRQIRNFLHQEKPDIVCLQEVISHDRKDAGLFLSIENIQEALELPFMVMAPVFSFRYMRSIARFGNGILSRSPIQKSEIIFTYLEHKDDFEFETDNANVRNFVHTVINMGGKTCNILTHHGYHIDSHKNGDKETLGQMKQLGNYIDALSGPIILTGDFNLAPHSESLEVLNSRLENLSISHNLKTTRTPLTHKTEVCDYIFVNNQVKVRDFHASDEVISDHKALVLEFDI